MKPKFTLMLVAAMAMSAAVVNAQTVSGESPAAPSSASALTSGEVRKIDDEQGKVTIKHEPIANLDMPSMTMVFRVAQPGMLKELKTGDKVQFRAENRDGAIVVTQIQAQK